MNTRTCYYVAIKVYLKILSLQMGDSEMTSLLVSWAVLY